MAHPDHQALLAAFRRACGTITTCDRADPNDGYTHIHGPSSPAVPHAKRCATHAVVIEKFNGTVSPRAPVGQQLQGLDRPECSIKSDVLGHSHRKNYGNFGVGFDTATIRQRWSTLDDFARAVIAASQAAGQW